MTYTTQITIWSRIGVTPVTNRTGAFCDRLEDFSIECATPADARAATKDAIQKVAHGHTGFFEMADHPNQNTRSGWVI
jgi:hypothetical protein